MSIGFVELNYRITRRFGLRVPIESWRSVMGDRMPFDLTAGEICTVVESQLRELHVGDADIPDARAFDGDVWPVVRELIAAIIAKDVSVSAEDIRRETWLVRDLMRVDT